jgi:hypothetical protein
VHNLWQALPQIFASAVGSPLGILGLAIVAISFVGYRIFLRTSERNKLIFFGMLIAGVSMFAFAALNTSTGPLARSVVLKSAAEAWIKTAKAARVSGSIVSGSMVPEPVSSARAVFERAWQASSEAERNGLSEQVAYDALSLTSKVYRAQEFKSTEKPSSFRWIDEAIRVFSDRNSANFLIESLMDRIGLCLDVTQLASPDRELFGRNRESCVASINQLSNIVDDARKADAFRLSSRFLYDSARPDTNRLDAQWNNEDLLASYAYAEKAVQAAPSELKNATQLARVTVRASKNTPQDVDPEWGRKLRSAKDRLKSLWVQKAHTLQLGVARLPALNNLGVVALEVVNREWRGAPLAQRPSLAPTLLAELDSDAIDILREAIVLLDASENAKSHGFDVRFDLARALANRVVLLKQTNPHLSDATFNELKALMKNASERATAEQLKSALANVRGDSSFTLLSPLQQKQLVETMSQ